MDDQLRVLVTGGSGYLGQFVICGLCSTYQVAYTYIRQPVPHPPGVRAFQGNIATGQGLTDAVLSFQPAVVINCAALSQPAVCERDYDACKAVNVPVKLVEALRQLEQQNGITALLVQLSTDQVYDGSRPWWTEADPTQPVNAYGRSKLEAEVMLQQLWPGRFVALRSSLIVGPEPPLAPVGRSLFVQFVQQALSRGDELDLFVDEYRCYNMGGPDRMNRLDLGMAIAQHCGYNTAAVKPSLSAEVARGYKSPLDISMRMDLLLDHMPSIRLTQFADAVDKIFPRMQK
eukprot:gene13167-13297_t